MAFQTRNLLCNQGLTKVPYGHPGQVVFKAGQVTFHGRLPNVGQVPGKTLHQLNDKQEVAINSNLKPYLYFWLINSFLSQKSRLNLICLHYE